MMRTGIRILAVALVLTAVAVAPAMAQKVYTNRDLKDVQVPGAYTNKDLKFLEPIPTQKAPLVEPAPMDLTTLAEITPEPDIRRAVLTDVRDRLQAELDYELARIEVAYSPAGGGFNPTSPRVGLKSKTADRLEYLRREIYLRDQQIQRLP